MSIAELKKKLNTLFPEEEGQVLKVLSEMERVELINDKRYAQQLVHHLTLRPIGRLKIMMEARKRGMDKDLMESILMESDYNEEENAKKALEQKEATVHEEDPRKRKFKLMNFLRNRGFTDSVIYHVLK